MNGRMTWARQGPNGVEGNLELVAAVVAPTVTISVKPKTLVSDFGVCGGGG